MTIFQVTCNRGTYTVNAAGADELLQGIRDQYTVEIQERCELRIDVNDRMFPTGRGELIDEITGQVDDRLTITQAIT